MTTSTDDKPNRQVKAKQDLHFAASLLRARGESKTAQERELAEANRLVDHNCERADFWRLGMNRENRDG